MAEGWSKRLKVRCIAAAAVVMAVGMHQPLLSGQTTQPPAATASLPSVPAVAARTSIVLLGDLAPVDGDSARHLAAAVREINLLRPAAVFTVGGLVEGRTRSPQRYAEEVASLRELLRPLQMPWFPCVGRTDVVSGTRDAEDRTFEKLYMQSIGPLYFSRDVGAVHMIVLDSEEGCGAGNVVSETQLAWLKADLNRAFIQGGPEQAYRRRDSRVRTQWVVLLVHRPLWRLSEEAMNPPGGAGNWDRVHRLLVDFNQRPIVSVEGGDVAAGPRVAGVWAGAGRAYSKEATRDGIRYTVVGATAARLDEDPANAVRHFTVLTFDENDAQVHPTLVTIGPRQAGEAAILPDDVVTERERQVLDAIEHLPVTALGLEGAIELPRAVVPTAAPPASQPETHAESRAATQAELPAVIPAVLVPPPEPRPVLMNIGNPLDVPLDVQVRLASGSENGGLAGAGSSAGSGGWEMDLPHQIRHLEPGAKEQWKAKFTWNGRATEVIPPVVEFVVHWADPRGGEGAGSSVREVVLRRRVPVLTQTVVPTVPEVSMSGEAAWIDAASGALYSWKEDAREGSGERAPEWEMVADEARVYLRVRVEDGVKSYWPTMNVDPHWGGLASDAVSVAWQREDGHGKVERFWVLPFGPKGAELWEAAGRNVEAVAGVLQLQRMDSAKLKSAEVHLESRAEGYVVTIAMPRAWFVGGGGGTGEAEWVPLAIEVSNNNEGAVTEETSSGPMSMGAEGWGRVHILEVQRSTPTGKLHS